MVFSALTFWHLVLAPAITDSARVEAGRLVVEPVGVSFEIPQGWLSRVTTSAGPTCDLKGPQARSVNVDRVGLQSVTGPSSHYGDQYYSAFADSIFAVSELVAHLGALGWRDCDNTNSDLQMRVYVTERSSLDIQRRLPNIQLSPFPGYSKPILAAARDSAEWHIEQANWSFNCGDCIGFERFEMYSTRVGLRTVSLVFMYTPMHWHETETTAQRLVDVRSILQSFRRSARAGI